MKPFGVRSFESEVRAEESGKPIVSSLISPYDAKTPDRYGTWFEPKGWRLDNFRKTGIVSLNHMASFLPIGPLPIGKNLGFEVVPRGLVATTEFAVDEPNPVGDWARLAFSLVSKGFLRGWSQIFDAFGWREKDGSEVRREPGTMFFERPGRTYTDMELMDYGPVFLVGDGRAETLSVGRSAEEARAVHDEVVAFGKRGLDVPAPFVDMLDVYARMLAEFADKIEAGAKPDLGDPAGTGRTGDGIVPGREEEDVEGKVAWSRAALSLAARVAYARLGELQRGDGLRRP